MPTRVVSFRIARALIPAWTIVATALACGCANNDAVELTVDVRTDFAPFDEFRAVRTEVLSSTSRSAEAAQTQTFQAERTQSYVRGQRVAELKVSVPLRTLVRVTLLDARGAPVVARETRIDMRERYALTVVITRDCRGVRCPGTGDSPMNTTCYAGRCVDPSCSTADPSMCGVPECSDDFDCPAPAATCGRARCIESACFTTGDDTACAPTEWCSPERGCVPRIVVDAGGVDAGGRDGGGRDAGVMDAARIDAGRSDAAVIDAGRFDAGTGARDAGFDGGSEMPDAGSDAGPPPCDPLTSRVVNGACRRCDVFVPRDAPTITAGIAAAPAPGLVCLSAGTFAESFSMRRRVDVVGEPRGNSDVPYPTVIDGFVTVIDLLGLDREVTTLSTMAVHATANPAIVSCATAACAGERLIGPQVLAFIGESLELTSTPGPLEGSCGLFFMPGGQLELTIRDTECTANAPFIVLHNPAGTVVDEHVVFERDTLRNTSTTMEGTDSLSITMGTFDPRTAMTSQYLAGSRLRVSIVNNVFEGISLAGVKLGAISSLTAADRARSEIRVAHGTFIDSLRRVGARAIQSTAATRGGPLVFANNLSVGFSSGAIGGLPGDVATGNLSVTSDCFVSGSRRLAAGCAAIDAVTSEGASDDRDGWPRPVDGNGDGSVIADVGAYERHF